MDNSIHILIFTISSLFPITNPIGNAAIFLSLTSEVDDQRKRILALRGAIYMFIILEVFFIGGSYILKFFGLSLYGIRIAGGLVIAKYGWNQLQPKREHTHSDEEHSEAKQMADISFSPLAMPLLAGPGAIASVLGITSVVTPGITSFLTVSIGILITCTICWVILRESKWLLGILGVNGANALTKVMGFLLLCIGVQLILDGAQQIF